jgi:hypothetical protein
MLTDLLLEEIEAGQGETLARLARRAPRTRLDRPVGASCLFRWARSGVAGPDGQRVYLEAARLAGRWVSTPGALRRFIAAQTPRRETEPTGAPRTPGRRQRAADRAGRELDGLGIR